jgi:hypothetical protein
MVKGSVNCEHEPLKLVSQVVLLVGIIKVCEYASVGNFIWSFGYVADISPQGTSLQALYAKRSTFESWFVHVFL